MSDGGDDHDLFGDEEVPAASGSGSNVHSVVASPASPKPGNDNEDEGGDLFGDEEEAEDDDRPRRGSHTATPSSLRSRSRTRSESRSGSRSPLANPLEYEEQDEEGDTQPDVMNIVIPQWSKLQPTDGKVWHMKLPAYVNIESKPFDPDLYRQTLDDEPVESNIAAKSKMIGVRNTIRWKWVTGPDGEPTKQTNARMLRWSDGSVSLQLGSDLFDVAPSYGATLARPQDAQTSTSNTATSIAEAENTQSSTTFICVAAPSEQVLVTENTIAGQLSLLPTSMDSKTHMELVKHVGQQHVKHSKMKMLEETNLDENALQKLLLKSAPREIVKPKSASKKNGTSSAVKGKGRKSFTRRGYSSDEDEDDGIDDDGPQRRRRGESVEYEEDDGFVVADSEDEDDYGGSRKRKAGKSKKRKGSEEDDDVDEMDEMEQAERRIEQRERERKRAKKDGGGGAGKKSREYVETDEEDDDEDDVDVDAEGEEEMEMDVESEED